MSCGRPSSTRSEDSLKGGTPGVTRRSGQAAWRVAMCRTEFLCHTPRDDTSCLCDRADSCQNWAECFSRPLLVGSCETGNALLTMPQ